MFPYLEVAGQAGVGDVDVVRALQRGEGGVQRLAVAPCHAKDCEIGKERYTLGCKHTRMPACRESRMERVLQAYKGCIGHPPGITRNAP